MVAKAKKKGESMKIKAFGLSLGIMWGLTLVYITAMAYIGKYPLVFSMMNELYFGIIPLKPFGFLVALAIGFVDAFIFGLILGFLYKKLS